MYDPVSRALDQHEFDTLKASFTNASDRVRHIMLISIVASILVFAAYRNAHQKMWIELRLERARVASRNQVWADDIDQRLSFCRSGDVGRARLKDSCDEVQQAVNWFRDLGHSEDSFKGALEAMEDTRVSETQLVKVPFLGIQFDINDLGTFSAMGLSVIAMVLAYSMVRYHENLYLCVWKIRRVTELEGRYDDNESKANFLYHSLAMEQVFSRAPTLARWRNQVVFGRLPWLFLLAVPVIVQSLVFFHDLDTVPKGQMFSSRLTAMTIWGFEVPLFLVLSISTFISFIYAISADKRWATTFFAINPSLGHLNHPHWREWVFPSYFPRFRRIRESGEELLYLFDKNSFRVWQIGRELPKGRREIKAITDYPDNIFDLTKLKDGKSYEFRTEGDSVRVVCDQPATSLAGRRLRVGDVVSGGEEKVYTLYRTLRDQVKKITVDETGEASTEDYGRPIGRRGPRRYGQRFIDLACFGGDVFLVEPRSRDLWRVSQSESRAEPIGSFAWFPVAIVSFADELLIAEVPRVGLRWLLRRWKPVRVRRIDPMRARRSEAAPAPEATGKNIAATSPS